MGQLKFVIVETTRRCNLRCTHCAVSEENNLGSYVWEDLPIDGFRQLLPMLREHKPEVQLSGHGETLLHPHFEEMLEATLDAGCSVRLQTNGTILTQRVIDILVGAGAALVVVSLDAASPELFENIRRRAKLHKIIANLERLVETKRQRGSELPRLAIEFVAMRQNVGELSDVIALAGRLGAVEFSVTELKEYPLTAGQSLAGDPKMRDVAEVARAEAAKWGMSLHLPPIPGSEVVGVERLTIDRSTPQSYQGLRKTCREPWERAFVQFNGDVWPCCWISEAYGNLTQQSFEQVWDGPKYRALREALESDDPPATCVNCPVYGWEPAAT